MSEFQLEASPRVARGKGGARQVRREGSVPGVVYGVSDPLPVQVPEREARRIVHHMHGGSQMVTLKLPKASGGDRQVLIKEVQTTAVGGHLVHIDFNEVSADQTVKVAVEVRPVGVSAGVRLGGTQQMVMHEIQVECLPKDLPDGIEVDVSALEIGHALHIEDITFPEGVVPMAEPDAAVIVISGRMKEEVEVEPVEGEEGEEGEAIAAEGEEGEEGESE